MPKKLLYILFLLALSYPLFAQIYVSNDMDEEEKWERKRSTEGIADIDRDGIADTLFYDFLKDQLVCKLSTRNYDEFPIPDIEILCNTYIDAEEGGFTYHLSCMRNFHYSYYSYDKKTGKFRWDMFSDEFLGNAANDGSGYESFNLVTGEFTGDMNYFDMDIGYLFHLPTVSHKYDVPPIYLGDDQYDLIPNYDSLYTICREKMEKEFIKSPANYDEFKNLFKKITPSDSIFIEIQDAYHISEDSPFHIYPDTEKKVVTQTYLPGCNGADIFIVLLRGFDDEGEINESEAWIFQNGILKTIHPVTDTASLLNSLSLPEK